MKITHELSQKPYYRCLICPDFRNLCGGMPTRGLTLPEWCEMVRDVMDFFGLSCAFVAKEAGVSQRTVERIHAVKIDQDIMRSVGRSIELVVFGNVTKLMCNRDIDTTAAEKIADLEKKLAEITKDRDRLAKIIDRFFDI